MRETTAVAVIFTLGMVVSIALKTYYGVLIAALGIPAYLAYTARHQNVLASSRLYDRDLFIMIVIAILVIIAFNYLWDPRLGLITLAIVVPILALYADRLKGGKEAQKA
ncbi:hypothetical protein [Thermococcus sp.]